MVSWEESLPLGLSMVCPPTPEWRWVFCPCTPACLGHWRQHGITMRGEPLNTSSPLPLPEAQQPDIYHMDIITWVDLVGDLRTSITRVRTVMREALRPASSMRSTGHGTKANGLLMVLKSGTTPTETLRSTSLRALRLTGTR